MQVPLAPEAAAVPQAKPKPAATCDQLEFREEFPVVYDGDQLGVIRWDTALTRHEFEPIETATLWHDDLKVIVAFMEEKLAAHKARPVAG